ncbi:Fibrous Sheath-Interacting Protein 2 [Manis pentadactyla]|nr:Fibrous Sheath-Interacting Protein 2 [Manis pentadactyla]
MKTTATALRAERNQPLQRRKKKRLIVYKKMQENGFKREETKESTFDHRGQDGTHCGHDRRDRRMMCKQLAGLGNG